MLTRYQSTHYTRSTINWPKKNWYFYQQLTRWYSCKIPKGALILLCGEHAAILEKLQACKNSISCSIEHINSYIQQQKSELKKFDYIIFSQSIIHAYDVQELFKSIKILCSHDTRIIIDTYQPLWEPILWLLEILRFKKPSEMKHWISQKDLHNFLCLTDFEVIKQEQFLLFPTYCPIISYISNLIGQLPIINRFCLISSIIARPIKQHNKEFSVSVIIPCKNERGNIESIINQCPQLGSSTELIFIEGGSSDNTAQEIERCIRKYPKKIIFHLTQTQKGKKQAVYQGFEKASGDILMILDGDHTVPVQELQKFYDVLVIHKGEFINGSRLVYGMETGAMRFLNMLANHFFARLFSWILNQSIKDTLCGTKVFFKKDFIPMMQGIKELGNFDPFGDFELLFGAAKLNLKIIDMPVHYKARTYGQTQIHRFYHGFILLKMSVIALTFFKWQFDNE